MLEIRNTGALAPEREFTKSMDTFYIPAHGFTEENHDDGFFALRRGFAQAGFNLVVNEWVNGTNTKPADQANYLYRKVRNAHERHNFAPFALASHSRGAQPVLEAATKIKESEFGDRLTGVILLSPAPYHEPVFTIFKRYRHHYPNDYDTFPPELQASLEGIALPDLPSDLPVVIFSGIGETIFTHMAEWNMLKKYDGHSEHHEVFTHNRWHPNLEEYAPAIAEHARPLSGITEPLYTELPPGLDETELKWVGTDAIQFARLPRGRVGLRENDIVIGTFPPGIWVNFHDNARNGIYDEV